MFQVLLDAALTKPLLQYSNTSKCFSLNNNSHALIKNTHIITEILLDWRIWSANIDTTTYIWGTMFKALEHLLCAENITYTFNVSLLHSVSIVRRLLSICLVSTIVKMNQFIIQIDCKLYLIYINKCKMSKNVC